MALEIERRFLVTGTTWRAHVGWEAELSQGYLLSRDDGLTVRVRMQQQMNREPQAWLTIKAVPSSGAPTYARLEYEYPIPIADAQAILALAPCRLEKHRHGLLLPGGDWILDVFSGKNAPLVIAEVELKHPEDPIEIPPWCGKEITGLHQLSNASLSFNPLQQWDQEAVEALWQYEGSSISQPE